MKKGKINFKIKRDGDGVKFVSIKEPKRHLKNKQSTISSRHLNVQCIDSEQIDRIMQIQKEYVYTTNSPLKLIGKITNALKNITKLKD